MTLKELLKKIMEDGSKNIELTEEGITRAAQEKGISPEDIKEALENFEGFPLDEDDLEGIAGGTSQVFAPRSNPGSFSQPPILY
jgi:hypothetical protein